MKITHDMTDAAVLHEIGARLQRRRIDAGLTQAQLAEEAGVSKRTVERIETGNSTDFTMLIRLLRALKLDALDQFIPDLPQSPIVLLKHNGRVRQRVGHSRREAEHFPGRKQSWKWGE